MRLRIHVSIAAIRATGDRKPTDADDTGTELSSQLSPRQVLRHKATAVSPRDLLRPPLDPDHERASKPDPASDSRIRLPRENRGL